MTVFKFNMIALILIYIGAITLGFLYNTILGWCISLYSLCSIIYYSIILNRSKHETNITNS